MYFPYVPPPEVPEVLMFNTSVAKPTAIRLVMLPVTSVIAHNRILDKLFLSFFSVIAYVILM